MSDFKELIHKFYNEDKIINQLCNFDKSKISDLKYFTIFGLVNRIINNLTEDLILVTPAKKELAYLSGTISSLNFYKDEFESKLSNFEQWLIPGSNVKLCASGNETGKIYKYLGKKNNEFIILGSLHDSSIKIEHKIKTLLQLYPVKNNKIKKNEIGKKGFIPKPNNPLIDKILNINGFGNPLLYENKILILTNLLNSFTNFFQSQKIIHEDYNLSELLKYGQMHENGEIKDHELEPLIVFTKDISSIYEYSNISNSKKIIICDDIRKIHDNYSIFKQIKDNNQDLKFLIFSEEREFEYCKKLISFEKINIWKLSKSEIKEFYTNSEIKKNSSLRLLQSKNMNNISKKIIFLETEDTNFTQLNLKFKQIFKQSEFFDENIKENIRELTKNLFYKMFELRDHIFGFTENLKKQTEESLKNFFIKLKTMESYLETSVFDDLIELANQFKIILQSEDKIFKKRLNELYENIKLREQDSKGEYAILTYDLEIKNYYKENIKKNWNLDVDVIYSIHSNKDFKNLIIPAELTQSKITTLLESDNFQNIYLIGGKSFKEEINSVENKIHNRWLNINIDNEKKCEITNIDKKFSNYFFSPEQMKNSTFDSNKQIEVNLENFYESNNFSKYIDKEDGDDKNIKVPAFLVVFNGDAYAFITENYSTEIFNSIFDPSAYSKDIKTIRRDYKSISYGDILLLRYSSDRDVLDQESIMLLNNDKEKFNLIKSKTKKISEILYKYAKAPFRDQLKMFLDEIGYRKGIGNVYSLAEPETGTICPEDPSDLKKIFLACEKMSKLFDNSNYIFNEKETLEIYNSAKLYKKIHIKAGFSITQKLKNAVKKTNNLNFDGSPMRIDYSNGQVIFGSEEEGTPEGYIVQVNNYEEPRILKEHNIHSTNKLLFL